MAAVNSSTTPEMKAGVLKGEYGLFCFSHQNFIREEMEGRLAQQTYDQRVRAFVVDEAHTEKKW